jgi:hypothetical protein
VALFILPYALFDNGGIVPEAHSMVKCAQSKITKALRVRRTPRDFVFAMFG